MSSCVSGLKDLSSVFIFSLNLPKVFKSPNIFSAAVADILAGILFILLLKASIS